MKEGIILKNENSVQVNEFSIDLLPAFMSRKSSVLKLNEEEEGDDDIELSLGLSLNGQFGFDPKRVNKLSRSSSIPEIMTTTTTEETNKSFAVKSLTPAVHAPLSRTCSLPIESEEWRKRKELQSLRRLEAKRKRLEKLKNPKSGRDLEGGVAGNGYGEFSLPFGLPKSSSVMKGEKAPLFRQGSIGSQGSGSSGISESECLPLPPRVAKRKVEEFGQVKKEEEDKNGGGLREGSSEAKEMLKKALLDMPYVSTTGEGTEGRKIGGFLYRYSKGEEAKIVCVCHGSFLSPAEFVKHAGGGDVSHPLKHILVSPSPLV